MCAVQISLAYLAHVVLVIFRRWREKPQVWEVIVCLCLFFVVNNLVFLIWKAYVDTGRCRDLLCQPDEVGEEQSFVKETPVSRERKLLVWTLF